MQDTPNATRGIAAITGIAGVIMIGISFAANAGPSSGATDDTLLAFGAAHHLGIVAGAWLQAVGSMVLCAFALMLASPPLAPSRAKLHFVQLGVGARVCVILIEVTLYLLAAQAASREAARFSMDAIQAVQHLYFIIAAPAVFVPLGFAVHESASLPRLLAYGAWLLGALFFVLGLVTLPQAALPASVTALGSVQAAWWLAAAVLVLRTPRPSLSRTNNA